MSNTQDFPINTRVEGFVPSTGETYVGTVVENKRPVHAVHRGGAQVHVHFDGHMSPVDWSVSQLRKL